MNVGQGFGLDAFPTPIALAVAIFDDRVSAALSPCLDQGWLEIFIHSLCGSAIPIARHLVPLNDLVLGHGGADGHRGHAEEAVLFARLCEALVETFAGFPEVPCNKGLSKFDTLRRGQRQGETLGVAVAVDFRRPIFRGTLQPYLPLCQSHLRISLRDADLMARRPEGHALAAESICTHTLRSFFCQASLFDDVFVFNLVFVVGFDDELPPRLVEFAYVALLRKTPHPSNNTYDFDLLHMYAWKGLCRHVHLIKKYVSE